MKLVVFHDHGAHWLDPLLKPGFRHCFAVVQAGDYMISVDGLAGLPALDVVAASTYDLVGFYRDEGFTVVEVDEGIPIRVPCISSNCVGMVKAVLGIRAPFALTPYQLYRRLTR